MRLVTLRASFHSCVFFLLKFAFMVVAFVPGEPEDAGRFPFLPENLRGVAKNVGSDAVYRADAAMCSAQAVQNESPAPSAPIASHLNNARCDAETALGSQRS